MLLKLEIHNYILINELHIDFSKGLSIITGETGAGKSIMIGALSLIAGSRADTGVLKNKEKKCLIEGSFRIKDYDLEGFFKENELDYDDVAIIRREIIPSGKSRAFINDTPVTLNQLKELGNKLVDIHSQHETLTLNNPFFQLSVVDNYAQNDKLLKEYKNDYKEYKALITQLDTLLEQEKQAKADLDYFMFQFSELEKANLQEDEQDALEQEQNTLSHAEEIKTKLADVISNFSNGEINILSQISQIKVLLNSIKDFHPEINELNNRCESAYIELKDISNEVEKISDEITNNPTRLEEINNRLNTIYNLQQKHRVNTIKGLLEIKDDLDKKINNISFIDDKINELKSKVDNYTEILKKKANQLSDNRNFVINEIEKQIESILTQLGMPATTLKIENKRLEEFNSYGIDNIKFMFSANKGGELKEIAKAASGGELSRLMLSVKSLISSKSLLPTIVFDEIDTGVSGDIAHKVGEILKKMSKNFQIISITHLPQIASKGDTHFMVYKSLNKDVTESYIKTLNYEERITEVAKMLSGENLTDAAIENAKELLKA